MTAQIPPPVPPPYRPQHTGPHTYLPQNGQAYPVQHGLRAPYPAPYAPVGPHVIRGDRNGMGTAGLVLGIISLCFAVIPIVGLVAWVLWPLGAIFSGVGLNRANRALATNRNAALAGMIVSLVAAAVCIAWVVFTAYTQVKYR